jgi:hypothetical protein
VTQWLMAMKAKEVDLQDILCVSSVRILFMEIMSFTCTCPLIILLATYAKGKPMHISLEKYLSYLAFCSIKCTLSYVQFILFNAGSILDNMNTLTIMITWRLIIFCLHIS